MKVTDLENLLDDESSWRKKEIAELIVLYQDNRLDVILKSIILLLYSHWEGFIKGSAKLYLTYIQECKVKVMDLNTNFQAIALKGIIASCFQSKDSLTMQNEIKLMAKLSTANIYDVGINIKDDQNRTIIDTRSNLTPEVFKNILEIIGLEYKAEYEAKRNHLDANFIFRRHIIAHGSKLENDANFTLDISTIVKLRDLVFVILDVMKEEIIDYARNEFYLLANSAALAEYQKQKESQVQTIFNNLSSY